MTISFSHVGSLGSYLFLNSISDFCFFLAPLVLANENYAKECILISKNKFTILDSGALEIAVGTENYDIKDEIYLEIAVNMGVREIVCPDYPNDPHGSLLRSKEFIKKWKKLPFNVRPRLMVVPHAYTKREWYINAGELIKGIDNYTIGIPRIFAERCGGNEVDFRLNIAERIRKTNSSASIHLLGAGNNFLYELSFLTKTKLVRSIDSTFLHRYGCTGLNPEKEYAPPQPLKYKFKPQGYMKRVKSLLDKINQAYKA